MKKMLLCFSALFCLPCPAQQNWALRQRMPESFGTNAIAGRPGCYLIATTNYPSTPIGNSRRFIRSTDGLTWQDITLPHARVLYSTGNGFVGGGYDGVWTSPDGLSSQVRLSSSSFSSQLVGLAHGGDCWVAALGDGRLFRAILPEGPWVEVLSPGSNVYSLMFANGSFWIFGWDGGVKSTNGVDWVPAQFLTFDETEGFAAGRFFSKQYNSIDGRNWNVSQHYFEAIGGGPGIVVGALSGKFYTSSDYLTYTASSTGLAAPISKVAFCGDLWVATSDSGHILTANHSQPPLTAPPLTIEPAVDLSWPSIVGRQYQIQTSGTGTTWTDSGAPMLGTGATMHFNAPTTGQRRFFRVSVR